MARNSCNLRHLRRADLGGGRAIELIDGDLVVTRTAMELGYRSTSAFVYAFHIDIECSPQAYMCGSSMNRSSLANNDPK